MPTDMRSLSPAETLVYLEANDLAGVLQPIVDNKVFEQAAKYKPDLSAIRGVQLAIAVTGFESTEEKLNDDMSIGRIQPRFVAIADTHAWNWQAVSFAETQLGGFVADIYDSDLTRETIDKYGGKYFVWTAGDGRKAFALVIDSIIYFGNDENSIEKCLAVRRGEADSIIKAGKVKPSDPAMIASGYVSTDGVAQIANIIGVTVGKEIDGEPEVQSITAGILPQLLRGMVSEIAWSAKTTEWGVEDTYDVSFKPEVANVFAETLSRSNLQETGLEEFVPANAVSVTRYALNDPQIAWRSVLLTAVSQMDAVSGRFVAALSTGLFEPFGISDPEMFLSGAAGHGILTAYLDRNGDQAVVITRVKAVELVKRSLSPEIDLAKAPEVIEGGKVWRSSDGSTAAAFLDDLVISGDAEGVLKCLRTRSGDKSFAENGRFKEFEAADGPVLTVANEVDERASLIEVLSEKKDAGAGITQRTISTIHFDRAGMHRRKLSSFGLIGSIIAQFAQE